MLSPFTKKSIQKIIDMGIMFAIFYCIHSLQEDMIAYKSMTHLLCRHLAILTCSRDDAMKQYFLGNLLIQK